ncbi:MAG TPA: DUF5676 family membrane protein [Pyrinomonadaceae bacterium]|jgi:hypothetical protein|nr:DUF5676 family membrane protein [Pyrinomonadaceae bacterium]
MNRLNVKKFGFAVGATAALLYLGCMLVMFTVGANGTARFFNSLLHGLDVSGIIRVGMPLWEAVIGIIEIFILGWLSGACVAAIYNATLKE